MTKVDTNVFSKGQFLLCKKKLILTKGSLKQTIKMLVFEWQHIFDLFCGGVFLTDGRHSYGYWLCSFCRLVLLFFVWSRHLKLNEMKLVRNFTFSYKYDTSFHVNLPPNSWMFIYINIISYLHPHPSMLIYIQCNFMFI